MPAIPTAERPPRGLDAYWLGHWRHCLKVLKEQDTWRWEQRPLLDEYVAALIAARDAADGLGWLDRFVDHVERLTNEADEVDWNAVSRVTARLDRIAAGLPTVWDRHTKRAAALAELLVLTPRAQRAHGVGARAREPETVDPETAAVDALEQLGRRGHLRAVS